MEPDGLHWDHNVPQDQGLFVHVLATDRNVKLRKLQQVGLIVKLFVCDQGSNNGSMID